MSARKIFCWGISVGAYLILSACSDKNQAQDLSDFSEKNQVGLEENLYQNPVFEPVLADPTVVKAGEYFYAYGTEDNWGNEGGYHLVPVIRSEDLVNWTLIGDAFQQKPDWKERGGIWAPDVTKVNDQYYMYYSFSTWGDSDPGIGLAIADSPEGSFLDQGKVFLSQEIGVDNSIDPFYIQEGGDKYLFWGSFHGIYAVRLSDDGTEAVGEKKKIASDHLEAAYVYKKNDYYYLFGSSGSCCEGANSTYKVLVGRSYSLLGPYVDRNGNLLGEGSFGELLIEGHTDTVGYAGPGHNAEIITDDEGNDWLLYHAMNKQNAKLDNGTNRRSLMLDKLVWENAWPTVAGQQPSIQPTKAPVFHE